MAGEVGHVVYGARVATYLGEKVSSPDYWAGTLFPDIRHLGVTSRKKSHETGLSLDGLAVTGSSDFETGMRVHSWIDEIRMKFLDKENMKEVLPWHPFVPHALKLFEDEMLYDRFDDWNLIDRALNRVYDEELKLVHLEEYVVKWHRILQDYFKSLPTDETRLQLSLAIGLSESSAEEINILVNELKETGTAAKLINGFVHHLEDLLT